MTLTYEIELANGGGSVNISGFVPVSMSAIQEVGLSASCVLACISACVASGDPKYFASYETMGKWIGVDRDTISKYIPILIQNGYISYDGKDKTNVNRFYVYPKGRFQIQVSGKYKTSVNADGFIMIFRELAYRGFSIPEMAAYGMAYLYKDSTYPLSTARFSTILNTPYRTIVRAVTRLTREGLLEKSGRFYCWKEE